MDRYLDSRVRSDQSTIRAVNSNIVILKRCPCGALVEEHGAGGCMRTGCDLSRTILITHRNFVYEKGRAR